jgi:hypothetical protein
MPTLRRNILIFHQAALGDFVITWPIALALARMFPQSRVIYVTASSKGKLAEKVLGVESLDAETGWHALFADGRGLPEENRKRLENAHLILSFGTSDSDVWEQNLRAIAPEATYLRLNTKPDPSLRCNEDVPPELSDHVTTHLLHQLRVNPSIHTAAAQILRSITSRGIGCRRAAANRFVIHPGAGKPEKCWPMENFVALIERLKKDATTARVLLGEAELDKWPADAISRVESVAEVHRPTTYLELLDEIAQANVFVGNDSGPAHLAAIIGVPTVALFGSSPDRWRPIGPRVTILHASAIDRIGVRDVLRAIQQNSHPHPLADYRERE